MNCKFCKKEIGHWEVQEVTSHRTICKMANGKLDIGDKLVLKHYKSFRCPSCHLEVLQGSKKKALKLLNSKAKDI